ETKPDRVIVGMAERRGRLPLPSLLAAPMSGVEGVGAGGGYERLTGKLALQARSPSSPTLSPGVRKPRGERVVGGVVSLVASVVGLVAFAPLMALIAVVIRLDSRGPALFIQDRIGLRGKRFRLVKFRTMHPEAVHVSEWVRDNTNRVTRLGYWLRKYRLDESPAGVDSLPGERERRGT